MKSSQEISTTEATGIIFDIQRNSFVDGPGIRTTVFFKGCNLRCAWCHNPESQCNRPELMFYKDRCTGCGLCAELCEGDTEFTCPNHAKKWCGKVVTVDEVLAECMKDKLFFDISGGGVTFSGGECMLQTEFLVEILKKSKKNGLHTAIDTAGHVPYENFERVLNYTDLFLYDIKCADSNIHKQYTGVGNELILENLKKLLMAKAHVWIRIPIISGVNDTVEELQMIKDILSSYGKPDKIEFLPYHPMGENKYSAIKKEVHRFNVPSKDKMEKLKNVFPQYTT